MKTHPKRPGNSPGSGRLTSLEATVRKPRLGNNNSPADLERLEWTIAKARQTLSISGRVSTDSADLDLGNIQVIAHSTNGPQGGVCWSLTDGSFYLPDLPAGVYSLAVKPDQLYLAVPALADTAAVAPPVHLASDASQLPAPEGRQHTSPGQAKRRPGYGATTDRPPPMRAERMGGGEEGGLGPQPSAIEPQPAVRFVAGSPVAEPSQRVGVRVHAGAMSGLSSVQFTLNWDAQVLRYAGVGEFGLRGLGEGNFGAMLAEQGELTFSWDGPEGTGLPTLPVGSHVEGRARSPLRAADVPPPAAGRGLPALPEQSQKNIVP